MDAGLYLVGTPIGHLDDITLRALETLRGADMVLAEDTRHTRKLLARYDISTPLTSCHKFNEASRTALVCRWIAEEGKALALVSNAGMPAVSDPGARIVAACREREVRVYVVPGPSASTAALASSGFGGKGFHFEGFLPHKGAARRRRLADLAGEAGPVVLFESPHRVVKLMKEIAEVMGDRRVFVGRELTKRHEEALLDTADRLAATLEERGPRGEFTVVIAPAGKRRASGSPQGPGD